MRRPTRHSIAGVDSKIENCQLKLVGRFVCVSISILLPRMLCKRPRHLTDGFVDIKGERLKPLVRAYPSTRGHKGPREELAKRTNA